MIYKLFEYQHDRNILYKGPTVLYIYTHTEFENFRGPSFKAGGLGGLHELQESAPTPVKETRGRKAQEKKTLTL